MIAKVAGDNKIESVANKTFMIDKNNLARSSSTFPSTKKDPETVSNLL